MSLLHGAGPPLPPYGVHVSNKPAGQGSQQSGRWAEVVEARRRARGWSQERLAEEAGVSRYTIIRWEQGRRSDPDSVVAVALALDIEPVDAFRWIGFLPATETGAEPETDPELLELERQMDAARTAMQQTSDRDLRQRFARQLADMTTSFTELAERARTSEARPEMLAELYAELERAQTGRERDLIAQEIEQLVEQVRSRRAEEPPNEGGPRRKRKRKTG